mgnify:CR=1 FL=1
MDWTAKINAYCERTDPSLWAEPLNAASNAAFLVAALVMAWRLRGSGLTLGWLLVAVLAVVGVSSTLWHTLAVGWTGAADSASIGVFILIYLYAANRAYLGWPVWAAALGTLLAIPYLAAAGWLFDRLPFFAISSFYWPLVPLMLVYGWVRRGRRAETARGLAIAGGILTLSLAARSLDTPLCAAIPIGTHYFWHIFNGILLGWVIEIYRRHMVAASEAGR